MFEKIQSQTHRGLIIEEKVYEKVAQELEAGDIRKGLWTKATAKAQSDSEAEIKKEYMRLRAEMLLEEERLSRKEVERSGPWKRKDDIKLVALFVVAILGIILLLKLLL